MTVAKLLIMIGLIAESAKEVSQPDNYGPRTRHDVHGRSDQRGARIR